VISPNAQAAWQVLQQADRLYDTKQIDTALVAMAADITRKLSDHEPLLVCLMNGGLVPFGMLLPRLQFPLQVDYIHATRYGAQLQGSVLKWIAGPFMSPQDRTILLVDDILDEGTTLAAIEDYYRQHGARTVLKAVLVEKIRSRPVHIDVDFVGLTVPDRYVFGYGMDYKGYLRNAPGIYAVAESA
jgi:hypoxanthine phosphoribosyltransferase